MAQPNWLVTLTAAPRDWQQIQRRMASFGRGLRRRGTGAAYVYVAEVNPDTDHLAHVHLWLRGQRPREVRDLAVKAGFGEVVDVRSFATGVNRQPTVAYGLKNVLRGRPEASAVLWPGALEHLELNGNRLVHATHGFWRDWQGVPVQGGLRKARYLAHRSSPRHRGGPASSQRAHAHVGHPNSRIN